MAMRVGNMVFLPFTVSLAVLVAGCPKRPVAIVGSAPPPTAPVQAPAPPAAPTPAPPAVAPTLPPAAQAPPAAAAPPAPAAPPPASVRPADYMANPAVRDIVFDFDKSNVRAGDAKIMR
jgi:hypothetical protein